ncbi:hypothetical protein PYW08_013057 [Mythimna loreyi]|uniref:Uncharacterized protein n=1 Tax=Mythimna loreyi TaxID=667449 RepID=A0ACC2PYY8_9NEOP|nr:hypothetical protein PYW08_013057 [Mythimna loreyi]
MLIDKYSMDILCFCETWLKPDRMLFNVNNFSVASAFNRSSIGGGTLILCNNSLRYKERKDITACSVDRLCEVACAEVEGQIFLCVYRPPASNLTFFLIIIEEILNKLIKDNKLVFVCGDLNIDLLVDSSDKSKLLSLFSSFNLKCIFKEATRITPTSASCIDNIFTNCNIKDSSLISGVRSDHTGQLVSFEIVKKLQLGSTAKFRPLTINKLNRFNNNVISSLSTANFDSQDPNVNYSTLFSTVCQEFNKACPVKKVQISNKSKFNEWATAGIRKSRDTLYQLYQEKSLSSDCNLHNYVRLYSKIFKRVCNQAKSKLISKKIENSNNKIKAVWKAINKETGKINQRDQNELSLNINNKIISDRSTVAETLENFFTNIPIEVTKSLPSSSLLAESFLKEHFTKDIPTFEFKRISVDTIIKTFKSLNIKNTEDLWGISVKVLGDIIDTIAPVLTGIFNQCLDSGTFPDLMKQ